MNKDRIILEPYYKLDEDDDYCPFCHRSQGCNLNDEIRCAYGLTNIKVPEDCPLRIYNILVTLREGE